MMVVANRTPTIEPEPNRANPSPARMMPPKLNLRGRQEISESRRWPPSTLPVPIFTASGTTRSNQATLQRQRLIPDNPLAPGNMPLTQALHQRFNLDLLLGQRPPDHARRLKLPLH